MGGWYGGGGTDRGVTNGEGEENMGGGGMGPISDTGIGGSGSCPDLWFADE